MLRLLLLISLLCWPGMAATRCTTCKRDARGRIVRDAAVLRRFQRQHPCPSTNQPDGPCPGWIKDHIKELACGVNRGGIDAVENLQWQTVAEARWKNGWEERACRLTREQILAIRTPEDLKKAGLAK